MVYRRRSGPHLHRRMHYMIKELMDESLRPIIEVGIFPGCRALIDTGAVIPVWTAAESWLAGLESVHAMGRRGTVSGFGGSCEGNLYEITLDFDGLHYIDLPILASRMQNAPWHIILPATLFDHMVYTIDNIRRMVIFEVPDNQLVRHLKYRDKDGSLYILSQETPCRESA